MDFLLGQIEAYDVLGGDDMQVEEEQDGERVAKVVR